MLKKKNRLGRKLIARIFEEGRFINGDNLSFKFISNKNSSISAFSFIAPKALCKNAVKRNLLRRRGYIAMGKFFGRMPKHLSGVFIFGRKSLEFFAGKKNKDSDPNAHLEHEIKNILSKIN